jgi:hypothetical protein
VKTTEWMLTPSTPPSPPSPSPSAASTDAPATPPTSTPTSTQLQQRCTEIIQNWHHKRSLIDNATNLFNLPQLPYYEHILMRLMRIIEIGCTIDRSFLEQLLAAVHDQVTRDDDHFPAVEIANNIGGAAESMHRYAFCSLLLFLF